MSELFEVTARDLLTAYLVGNVLMLLAVAGGMWVAWPSRRPDEPVRVVDPEPTVELPARSHRLRTGTIHAPQYDRVAASERTVVIERTST